MNHRAPTMARRNPTRYLAEKKKPDTFSLLAKKET
jgi:hypothetical protein